MSHFIFYYSLNVIVLNVVMLVSVVMLSVVMLSVVMLCVVAYQEGHWGRRAKQGGGEELDIYYKLFCYKSVFENLYK